jgi:hypothetical protein
MTQRKTYTVNVSRNCRDVSSDEAVRMIAKALNERISLARDAVGSGPKVLRLTVSKEHADALRDLSGGRSMAASFRRLFSTVATVERPYRIPSSPSRELDLPATRESASSVSAKVTVRPNASAPLRLFEVPSWFDLANPTRESYWRSLGADYQLRMIVAHSSFQEKGSRARASVKTSSESRPRLGLIAWIGLAILLYWIS